jgi:hypothetical protein
MWSWTHLLPLAIASLVVGACSGSRAVPERPPRLEGRALPILRYSGSCDASGAVPVGASHFLVADDEDNRVRLYSNGGGRPRQEIDLSPDLDLGRGSKEADLEAATESGGLVYWMTSHGRSAKGKARPNRLRLAATKVDRDARGAVRIARVGSAYRQLLDDLLETPSLSSFGLQAAAQLAPKAAGGLNIEGLTSGPDGTLHIGLRSPLVHGKAVVLTIENAPQLAQGERARIGAPVLLDLGGRGIRGLSHVGNDILVLAGDPGSEHRPQLYLWTRGTDQARPLNGLDLGDLQPEAVVSGELEAGVLLLSDDGTRQIDGDLCKDLAESARKGFRGVRLDLDALRRVGATVQPDPPAPRAAPPPSP